MAKCIMVQGTSSNAGKSVLVAALCRIYSRRGYKVAPFKSQNMSLNSHITKDNREIAIAQVLQAEAADIEPNAHMNPILLKPQGNFISQVIIQGKYVGDMNFYDYQHEFRETARKAIEESLNILKEEYDIIIIEGAGSPAEINMRKEDLANMEIAHIANADVLLVADIDKGGVFASIAGTFSLLDEEDNKRLKAVVINKFRGNIDILMPGVKKIEKIIDAPVLGVIPFDDNLKLPEEDSASLNEHKFDLNKEIIIGVIKLPRIANFTDIYPFEFEEDIGLKLIDLDEEIGDVDALIIPGTRDVFGDLEKLKKNGMDEKIKKLAKDIPIVGICGGYELLGEKIHFGSGDNAPTTAHGLNLLKVETFYKNDENAEKIVKQSCGTIMNPEMNSMFSSIENEEVKGYEIHEGISQLTGSQPLLKINDNDDSKSIEYNGAIENNIFGSYFHGIFHNYNFRNAFLNFLREKKGIKPKFEEDPYEAKKDYSIEKLAKIVEDNIDMEFIDNLIK